jgi:hypothetical protein
MNQVPSKDKKPVSDQSMLRDAAPEFWNVWGIRALIAGAILGTAGFGISAISAYVLYRVADAAQSSLHSKTLDLTAEIETQKRLAKQFEAETEKLKAANLALEEKIAPRRLSVKQQTEIAQALSKLSDTVRIVRIFSYALDVEGLELAKQIAAVLDKARIRHADSFTSVAATDANIVVGVNVRGLDDELTNALALSLNTIGGLSISRFDDDTSGAALRNAPNLHDSEISAFVFVGAKPIPIIK